MRKFTKVIKTVIEKDIEQQMDEESKANQIKAQSKIQVASNMKEEAEQDTNLMKKMKDDKSDFLKKHSVKHVEDHHIKSALKNMKAIPSTISLPSG